MDPEEYELFITWAENILTRDLPPEKKRFGDKLGGKTGELKEILILILPGLQYRTEVAQVYAQVA